MDELFGLSDWSAGMVRDVARELIPANGAYDIQDGLLDDDGNVYVRGATARSSAAAYGTALSGLWEVPTSAGRRTLIAGARLAVLDAGGVPFPWTGYPAYAQKAISVASIGDLVVLPPYAFYQGINLYGGSRIAGYTGAGTVTVTLDSPVITGIGTTFLATVDAGAIFQIAVGAIPYVVKSVDSNTQLTLTSLYKEATTAGIAAFTVMPIVQFPVEPSSDLDVPTSVCVAGGRVLVLKGSRVRMSATVDPNLLRQRPWDFTNQDNVHEFSGTGIALASLRDRAFVFTTAGIWSIDGLAYEIVDAMGNPQHKVSKISGDVIARGVSSITSWRDSLVFAAIDGIYILSADGSLELISRTIGPLWRDHVAAGRLVGQMATFKDHVFVPVAGVETFVGRLDRRTKTQGGRSVPWTRFTQAELGDATGFVVKDPGGSPKLLAITDDNGWVLDASGIFRTSAAAVGASDANAEDYSLTVETRTMLVDGGNVALVRDLVFDYLLGIGVLAVSWSRDDFSTSTVVATTAAINSSTQKPRVIAIKASARRLTLRITIGPAILGGGYGASVGSKLRSVRGRGRRRGRWR